MSKTINIFVIQNTDKCVTSTDKDNCEGYLLSLLGYYRFNGAVTVTDIWSFIGTVTTKVMMSGGAKIKKLVIGSHGFGGPKGHFRIGNDVIDYASVTELNALRLLAPFFAKDADVFILACHTGQSELLLKKVSKALGGVKVHGYTECIEADGLSLDADGGQETVCILGKCITTDPQLPERENWFNWAR